jgi:hypothetical protein
MLAVSHDLYCNYSHNLPKSSELISVSSTPFKDYYLHQNLSNDQVITIIIRNAEISVITTTTNTVCFTKAS